MKLIRFFVAVFLLLGAAVLLRARDSAESLPPHQPVAEFPMQVGEWYGENVPIQPEVKNILGDGEFLLRFYRAPERPYIDFFMAYFPTQRTGSTIHSPQNCLPGAGWTPVNFSRIPLPYAGPDAPRVNRYVISKGLDRQLVLYWYQSNGRVVASEYRAKMYLVADSIRRHRSDGALLRVVTPIARNESEASAERRAMSFIGEIYPRLDQFIPR